MEIAPVHSVWKCCWGNLASDWGNPGRPKAIWAAAAHRPAPPSTPSTDRTLKYGMFSAAAAALAKRTRAQYCNKSPDTHSDGRYTTSPDNPAVLIGNRLLT